MARARPTVTLFPGVHMAAPTAEEARVIVRSIGRVLADSSRTLDIVIAEELVSRAQLRHLLDHGFMASAEGRALLRDRPELRDTDMNRLRALPNGTLGREFVRFLDANGFDYNIDEAASPMIEDPDEAYLLRRIRKNHDLWHVLLGLGPLGYEEVLVHAFTLSQVGIPSSVAIVALGAVKHMVFEGRWRALRHSVREAYELGARAPRLVLVRWEDHFADDLERVRARYGLHTVGAAA